MKTNPGRNECNSVNLLDYAMGRLTQNQAAEVEKHLRLCSECRDELTRYMALKEGATEIKNSPMPSYVADAVWQQLEGEIKKAEEKTSIRRALGTLVAYKPVKYAASLLIFLTFALSGYYFYSTLISSSANIKSGQSILVSNEKPEQLHFEVGAEVVLKEGSEAMVIESRTKSGVVRLKKGTLIAKVRKQQDDGRFEVHTEDAIVFVKGTRFSVSKNKSDSTAVSVIDGTVWVMPAGKHREILILETGESSDVLGEKPYLSSLKQKGELVIKERAYMEAADYFEKYLLSSIYEDNSDVELLLAEASEHSGNYKRAVELYKRVSEINNSLRAENSLALLANLYARIDRKENSLTVWEEYVNRFPAGIHLQEALYKLALNECATKKGRYYQLLIEKSQNNEIVEEMKEKCSR